MSEAAEDGARRAARMEAVIRAYFAACDAGDAKAIEACFTPDAVHYFPPDERYGPWRGARTIAEGWAAAVAHTGAKWTIDRMITDPESRQAVIEWTQFRPKQGKLLRGDEWYVFDDGCRLLAEVRCYFAAPEDPGRRTHELQGFDYAGRGYPMKAPE